MRKYIETSSKANEIRMLLNHPSHKNNLFIILEGKTDIRLFRSLLKSDCISIESVDGKIDLIKVVKDLKSDVENVIGICDADFDHINELTQDREKHGIYLTDMHDAELMLFDSPSLESFIDEYSDNDNHVELIESLKIEVLKAAFKIGLLRLINNNEKLNLNWKGLNFNSFINVDKLSVSVDLNKLVDDLIRRSKNIKDGVTKEIITSLYRERSSSEYCKLQICCGHDVCNITSMIYSQRWASCHTNINKEKVESSLRIGYTLQHFQSSELYKKLVIATEKLGFHVNDANKQNPHGLQKAPLRSAFCSR